MARVWTAEQRQAQRERAKKQFKDSNGRFVTLSYESAKYTGFKSEDFVAVDNKGEAYKNQKRVAREREKRKEKIREMEQRFVDAILHETHVGSPTDTMVVSSEQFDEELRDAVARHRKQKESQKPKSVAYYNESGQYISPRPTGEELEIAAYKLKMNPVKNESRDNQKIQILENAMKEKTVTEFIDAYGKMLQSIDFEGLSLDFVMKVLDEANMRIEEIQKLTDGEVGRFFSYSTSVPKDVFKRRFDAAVDVLQKDYLSRLFYGYKRDIKDAVSEVLGSYAPELVELYNEALKYIPNADVYYALDAGGRLNTAYILQSVWDTENADRAVQEAEKALMDIFINNTKFLPPELVEKIRNYFNS